MKTFIIYYVFHNYNNNYSSAVAAIIIEAKSTDDAVCNFFKMYEEDTNNKNVEYEIIDVEELE